MKAVEEDVVINNVKHSSQVKEDMKWRSAAISCHQKVICDSDQSCFRAVDRAEVWLEFFIQDV